jgi:hypothetical protein
MNGDTAYTFAFPEPTMLLDAIICLRMPPRSATVQ